MINKIVLKVQKVLNRNDWNVHPDSDMPEVEVGMFIEI